MPKLTPVDYDPFAAGPRLTPVDHDPFAANSQPYGMLPVSEDEKGNPRLDSNAGIIGSLKRLLLLPGNVASGKVDPMSDEGIAAATDLAGMITPAGVATRMGRAARVAAPTREQLFDAADTGFDAARATGVQYDAGAFRRVLDNLKSGLEDKGFLSDDAPKTHALLDSFDGGNALPITKMMSTRRSLRNKMQDFNNPPEQAAAGIAQRSLDDFLSSPPAGSVVVGPAEEAAATYREARGNYAAAKRSKTLGDKDYRADLNAATANSGMNVDNAVRNQAKALLLNKKLLAGFSAEEIAALDDVARGTPSRNAVRFLGNILGGGGGIGSAFTSSLGAGVGNYFAGPTGAMIGAGAIPVAGMAAKTAAGRMTQRAFDNVDELVRRRSPLYGVMQRRGSLPLRPELSANLMRGLAIRGLLSDDEQQ